MNKQMNLLIGMLFCGLVSTLFAGTYGGGSGSAADPYKIATKTHLLELAATTADYSSCFILTENIDLAGETFTRAVIAPDPGDSVIVDETTWEKSVEFQGIAFTGTFDGCGHQIDHLVIDNEDGGNLIGLFGYIGQGGNVKNLTLSDASVQGNNFTGTLSGFNAGNIINCSCTGTVDGDEVGGGLVGGNGGTISHSSTIVNLNGTDTWGGLTGQNKGIIQYCSSENTTVSCWDTGGLVGDNYGTINQCCSKGAVSVYDAGFSECIGGLVGWNVDGSVISNCYSTSMVTGRRGSVYYGGLVGENNGNIDQCYSTGSVTVGSGSEYVGGLVGYSYSGTITSCFWDTDTSVTSDGVGNVDPDPAGVQGKTTIQMQTQAAFIGWDFLGESANGSADTWRMCVNGVHYPKLTWQYVGAGDFACPDGVNTDDLLRLSQDWLLTYTTVFYGADATGDKIVNLADFAILANHWLEQ